MTVTEWLRKNLTQLSTVMLTCRAKVCAYLHSTSNFLSENVYFSYCRVSNEKKIGRFVIFYDIPLSLLQCSIWKWVACLLNVCILETKPTDISTS